MWHTYAVPFVSGTSYYLTLLIDGTLPKSHVMIYIHALSVGLTVLFLFSSDVFVRCCHRSEPAQVNCSPTITNTLPFSTLNISITLTLFVNLIMKMVGVTPANGMHVSLLLVAFIVTNKKARKHLRNRLRQNMDTFFVGRGNSVEPAVSVALVQLPLPVAGFTPSVPIRNNYL